MSETGSEEGLYGIRWKKPDLIIDPEAPVDTPAGRRAEANAPSEEEWEEIREEWRKLADEESL